MLLVLLVASDPAFALHDTGRAHPERPARLEAVARGVAAAGLHDAVLLLEPIEAPRAALERVHPTAHLEWLEARCRAGARLDPDTAVSPGSWRAALLAAGAGLSAVEALRQRAADAAFLVVRPPGHHAGRARAMGFCLINNVAVCAAELAERGERVLVFDYDAHHGNGTQDIFYDDARVLYVSFHEWPLYPGTGRLNEVGVGAGARTTLNVPLPAGATGDVYLRALDEVIDGVVERYRPTWALVSAGFDAHRADPLTGLGLSAGDFARLTERVAGYVPAGRLLAFLEGGYDLDALQASVAAALPALIGGRGAVPPGEQPTVGGPGRTVIDAVADHWRDLAG